MKTLRCLFMAVLVLGMSLPFVGCEFMDSQLLRDPVTGESKLESEVKIAKPFIPGPWGEIAGGAAILLTSLYGAFRAHRADVQTDANKNGIPDVDEKPKA